jgi:phosphoserine phosphatase RsbU/P
MAEECTLCCPPEEDTSSTHSELLTTALAHSPVVLFTQDMDLRFTSVVNPQRGCLPDDILGKTPSELFPPDDATSITSMNQRVLATGHAASATVCTHHQGMPACCDFLVEPQRDAHGVIVGLFGAATESISTAGKDHFQTTVLESINDSVIVTDLDGRISYWNRGAEEAFGYQAGEMLGQTPALLYPDADPEKLKVDLDSIAQGDDHIGEWLGKHKNGDPVWVDIRTTALRDHDGVCVGFVGVGKDITRRKRLEEQRDLLLLRERAMRQRLQEFLAMVAHEERQGMTVVLGHAHHLAGASAEHDLHPYQESITAIQQAAMRVQSLIGDLEDAAAVGEGRFAILPETTDLVRIARAAVTEYQIASERHLLRVDAPRRLHVVGDPLRLRQLIGNLIDNAIKYSPDGGNIVIRIGVQGDRLHLAVSDRGVGIPEEQRERIFELFHRSQTHTVIAGMGLGLYLCRAIAEAHGGQIAIESEPGQGSTFSVTLPAADPDS